MNNTITNMMKDLDDNISIIKETIRTKEIELKNDTEREILNMRLECDAKIKRLHEENNSKIESITSLVEIEIRKQASDALKKINDLRTTKNENSLKLDEIEENMYQKNEQKSSKTIR